MGQGPLALVRFPKGETLWPRRSKRAQRANSAAGAMRRAGAEISRMKVKMGQGPMADYHYKCNT